MKRKSCLVIGYINNNLGDDLFFKILFERYRKVDFYFYPPANMLELYKNKFKKNKNVIFYDNEPYLKKIKEEYPLEVIDIFPLICERAEKVDFYINIGGSIFIQNENWENDDRIKLKKHLGDKPSFIIGCNFGPGNQVFTDYYKKWFKNFDDICFRDKESYKKFKCLKNTRLSDDIVLIMKKNKKMIKTNRNVAVSLIDLDNRKELSSYKEYYYEYIKKNVSELLQENYKVQFFSFCETEGDMKAINEILELFSEKEKKQIKVFNYTTNIDEFLKAWRKNRYVIGTRFHSVVLALANGQEFCPISYSKKINNYLKMYAQNIKVINIKNIKNETKKIKFYNYNGQYNSKLQFKRIDEYLKK